MKMALLVSKDKILSQNINNAQPKEKIQALR